jgi:hypothetical protein
MKKESFIIRVDWYDAIKMLDDKHQAMLLRWFFLFHIEENFDPEKTGEITQETQWVLGYWKLFQPQLKYAADKYSKIVERNQSNGKKNGKKQINKPKNPVGPSGSYMSMSMSMDKSMSMENDNVNVVDNGNEIAREKTTTNDMNSILSKPPTTTDDDLNYFNSLPIAQRSVAIWFRHYAYPTDKKHLYVDIITTRRLIDWAEQWNEIKDDPAIVPYLSDQKSYPWPKETDMDAEGKVSAFRVYVEFAFRVKRDTYAPYFKDLTYLCQPHGKTGKPNIEHLAMDFQKWLNAQQKIMDQIVPKYGN